MQICQIVGYKNSGKTTVMNNLIRYFSSSDMKVGTLKHHGHGGEPDIVENTDSTMHIESGSLVSGVQGENITQLTFHMKMELDELIQMYNNFSIDLLLVEGYKNASYPKIVMVKNEQDFSLFKGLSNIIAIGTWDEGLFKNSGLPTFSINNIDENIVQLAEYVRRC
ncbi:molybdopterin-guanine dinucleotide biosynthesis protein B [Virgibacillus subterraneus]|uniref:Molybdopterin-guanine dinucleotide biosynthesis protein B n=1 Tax=Virgibacillus subterraneus TaxID=621109 RepID=A0A1H9FZS3_9BACI|nr:molybdopterin-guanine dinucleotide biosynthesis protein B [Virgibacillus subterraneus]SEQ43299.1 molybdopterin-guanine dinucleotide biosynthesis protein B [Virgibacillus subterraneus]